MIALDELAPIPNWPGYLVSRDGRVFSCWRQRHRGSGPAALLGSRSVIDETPRELSTFDRMKRGGEPSGYRSVCLRRDGAHRNLYVHELVLLAFVGPRPSPSHEILHGNGQRDDNRLENLRYGTVAENYDDRCSHGRQWNWGKRVAGDELAAGGDVEEFVGAFDDLLAEGAA